MSITIKLRVSLSCANYNQSEDSPLLCQLQSKWDFASPVPITIKVRKPITNTVRIPPPVPITIKVRIPSFCANYNQNEDFPLLYQLQSKWGCQLQTKWGFPPPVPITIKIRVSLSCANYNQREEQITNKVSFPPLVLIIIKERISLSCTNYNQSEDFSLLCQ